MLAKITPSKMSNSTSWCLKKSGNLGKVECAAAHFNETLPGMCPPAWDSFLCWPPTVPGSTIQLQCPRNSGYNVTRFASRICQENGTWTQNPIGNTFSAAGWTNYHPCLTNYSLDLMMRLRGSSNSTEVVMAKVNVAANTRILEMTGLIISALSLILALIIFGRFRNLWNNRTRIHKNLFIAMTIQVLTRLVVYIDRYVSNHLGFECYTLERMEYTCESAYTIMEYAKTSMFAWMFIEGLYLHNMITVAVFQEHLSFSFYYLIGWGAPVILTSIWAMMTADEFYGAVCWHGYNLSYTYLVVEGPRLVVIFLNLLFLLNIMRVLVTKLRESNSTEAQQVRKAVRAAIVLLPLLGITNSIQMVHSPIEKSVVEFATWSYGTSFLSSFQGFFCSLIYCFLNGEVQVQIRRYIRAKRHRKASGPRRKSLAPRASMVNHLNSKLKAVDEKITSGNHGFRDSHSKFDKEPGGKALNNAGRFVDAARVGGDGDKGIVDPFFENWDEAELSSHNNVIIELVEIPHSVIKQQENNAQNERFLETARNSTTVNNVEGGNSNSKHEAPKNVQSNHSERNVSNENENLGKFKYGEDTNTAHYTNTNENFSNIEASR